MSIAAGLYRRLPTEQPNPRSARIDLDGTLTILRKMNAEDRAVAPAVARVLPRLARAVDAAAACLRAGGRLVFVGAGTSGRLGVLEAAECPPTFHTLPAMIQAAMAGGPGAVFRSREGAEDSESGGKREIFRRARKGDVVVGIAASGVTPFVRGALAAARRRGCRTILVTANRRPRMPGVELVISPELGPEILAGSTRLKAGTATKMILNMLTTAAMIRLGKVYDHWMIDLKPSSRKLRLRAERIVSELAGKGPAASTSLLRRSGGGVKAAVLMGRFGWSEARARARLRAVGGSLRTALELRGKAR